MIPLRREEALRFMFQPPERFRMQNPVAIALKIRAQIVRIDRLFTPARLRALHREGREPLRFPLLQLLAYRHQNRPFA